MRRFSTTLYFCFSFMICVSSGLAAKNPALPGESTTRLKFETNEATWISLDISPDGKTIAFDVLGHIYTMPVTGGKAKMLTSGTSWNMFPRFSPDGSMLLITSDRSGSDDLWSMNVAGQDLKNITKMTLPVHQGTWSADGRHVFGTSLNMKVRHPVYRFNLFGDKQTIIPAGSRSPVTHFESHPTNGLVYFEHGDRSLYASGARIKTYNTATGEVSVLIDRTGGACNPALSPDGKKLAYVHRDDLETVLVVRDLETHQEKIICRTLDRDRLDSGGFYGAYPNMDWHPNGREIFIYFGGGINAVDVSSQQVRKIPFTVTVDREMQETMRFKGDVPQGTTTTRSHRWGQRTPDGILFETLGDFYLKSGSKTTNLTKSADHETNPVYHAGTKRIYFASWNDEELGAVYAMNLDGGNRKKLTSRPSQYGSLVVSKDGSKVAFVRGAGALRTGSRVENQSEFELVLLNGEQSETTVTHIEWSTNRYAKRPPTLFFGPDNTIYFTEYVNDKLTLKRIAHDGSSEKTLYTFSNATRAVISPNMEWIAFREYHRSFVTPFEFVGKPVTVTAADHKGFTKRVDQKGDGDFMEWSADGSKLTWTRGDSYCEKSLKDILAGTEVVEKTALSFEYEIDTPSSVIALKNVRVLTMNAQKDVLENTTVLIRHNRIEAIGDAVTVPDDAKVYDLTGRTIMPGMFDAHGHYGSPISALNVIEQRLYGLQANLAYGVTTMYDVYGTTQKDFWVSDMLQKGSIDGPRIYSVGDPVFVTRYRSKMYRPIKSAEDAMEIVQFNKDHGAPGVKDYSNHRREARQQLAAACRELGMNLVTESFGNPQMNMTQIIDGFTGLEHSMGLEPFYDDVIQLFKASKIGMTPTLVVVYNGPSGETYFHQRERLWENEKLTTFFRPDELIRLRRPRFFWPDDHYSVRMAKALRKLYANGVLLQMGAHGQMMGLGAHWEMELFTHGGFTPYEAIEIATINGFTHHGLDHELGSIEKGKLADLVIMTKNPLENIRNTRSIEYVLKNGVVYSGKDASRVYPNPKPAKKLYFME